MVAAVGLYSHTGGRCRKGLREELRLLALEEELESSGRAVAVLRDGAVDHTRCAGRHLFLLAPEHDHDVGVLLEAAALTEGRELRLAAGIPGGARQLRESDDDDAELPCQRFQIPRDGRDLLHAVLVVLAGADELDVVDDDHFDLLVRARAAGLRSQLHDRDAGRVVDEHRQTVQRGGSVSMMFPVRSARRSMREFSAR